MGRELLVGLDLAAVPTPAYVVDEGALAANLAVLDSVRRRTGCRILLALKAFAMWRTFPLLRTALDGVCASSVHEARLGREDFGGEVHAFAAAFTEDDIRELAGLADHVVFNSFAQRDRFAPLLRQLAPHIGLGLRVNPEHSEGHTPLYDPCAPGSRLGILRKHFAGKSLKGISGLHFHTLCEQNADCLERTLAAFERGFGEFIPGLEYVNFGGGHHITRDDYDIDLLCRLIRDFKKKYGVQVYLEPGEAVALNAGVLVATVLDIVENDMPIAIMDSAVPCHMPDCIEMPYRPNIVGAGKLGEKQHGYRIAGPSCLAGDVAGEYSFDEPLEIGSKLVFTDMAHYTMVKTNTFNGINLPSICLWRSEPAELEIVRSFGYADFRERLS
jgi:carboxynorspermidine decarboxylase